MFMEWNLDEVIELWCNIPNFGPTIYRHELIDHDDYIDVLFYIGSKTPLHMDMMIVLYIRCKPIVYDIYVYIYVGCIGHGPWSTWLMKCFVLGMDPEAHDWWYVLCWARGYGAHEYLHLCWA